MYLLLLGVLAASAIDANGWLLNPNSLPAGYGLAFSDTLALNSNLTAEADHSKERVYQATLVDCYDGDTCTFDVQLPSAGVYRPTGDNDYGLGVIVHDGVLPMMARVNQHVRLCDINAPELHPGNPPAAVKARDDLVNWMRGKKVHLHVPQNKHGDMYEKYGRLLAYIYVGDENLNEKQLKHGNAKPFIRCE